MKLYLNILVGWLSFTVIHAVQAADTKPGLPSASSPSATSNRGQKITTNAFTLSLDPEGITSVRHCILKLVLTNTGNEGVHVYSSFEEAGEQPFEKLSLKEPGGQVLLNPPEPPPPPPLSPEEEKKLTSEQLFDRIGATLKIGSGRYIYLKKGEAKTWTIALEKYFLLSAGLNHLDLSMRVYVEPKTQGPQTESQRPDMLFKNLPLQITADTQGR